MNARRVNILLALSWLASWRTTALRHERTFADQLLWKKKAGGREADYCLLNSDPQGQSLHLLWIGMALKLAIDVERAFVRDGKTCIMMITPAIPDTGSTRYCVLYSPAQVRLPALRPFSTASRLVI
jgi:hypothetical protein